MAQWARGASKGRAVFGTLRNVRISENSSTVKIGTGLAPDRLKQGDICRYVAVTVHAKFLKIKTERHQPTQDEMAVIALANRRLQPLGHSSDRADMPDRATLGKQRHGLVATKRAAFLRCLEVPNGGRSDRQR